MTSNTNPKPGNVLDLFNAIPRKDPADVKVVGNPGVEVVKSHVQGIARKGDCYLLTHSHVDGDAGQLLVVDRHLNAVTVNLPSPSIDGAALNHPGGCQAIGDYLVVPFEAIDRNVSRVSVFDVSVPAQPLALAQPASIERHDRKAGAAGIANVTVDDIEYWYLAIYDNGRVDMFRSDGRSFPETEFSFQFARDIPDGYESFCLVAEETNRLFGIGFRLDSITRDKADLYAIHLDTQRLELLESRRFLTNGLLNVHFRWGGGIDIRSRDELAILATGRNFLPFLLADSGSGGQSAGSPSRDTDRALLRPHCHINTFGVR